MRKKRKKLLKKHNNKLKLIFILFILQSSFLIFNEAGLIKLIRLKSNQAEVQSEVQTLLNQQIKLQEEIIKLEINEEYIEKIAREKFMMVKPGEKVFKVVDKKNIK